MSKRQKAVIFLLTNFAYTTVLLCSMVAGLLSVGSFILWDDVLLSLPPWVYATLFRTCLVLSALMTVLGIWILEQ